MFVVVDTDSLAADGVITDAARAEMEIRARGVMVTLAINIVLFSGIIFATGGLIFWLAKPIPVALSGLILLALGSVILLRGSSLYRMFGNAAALIGAGLLLGGAALEVASNYADSAGPILVVGGALVLGAALAIFRRGEGPLRFSSGVIAAMGLATHLFGLGFWTEVNMMSGLPVMAVNIYATVALIALGRTLDVRLVTALAIVPFAQILQTGSSYFRAVYVFYSPESTLTILTMLLLLGLCLFVALRYPERVARHARILGVMAFIVANMAALVGSLWGDVVGEHLWGPGFNRDDYANYRAWSDARTAFRETAFTISEHVYSIVWALALTAMIIWAAHRGNRALFNASVTFAAIHAYTQAFESFEGQPLFFAISGFAAIPLAWGLWRLNQVWFTGGQEHRREIS